MTIKLVLTDPNNLQNNPSVCVSFVHIFKQKGFKVKGIAKYITPQHPEYSHLFTFIEPMVGNTFPVKGIILISASCCTPIIAPAYHLVKGTTEESQISSAKKTYGI